MAIRYWIAGAGSVWNSPANWSTSSGGSSGASVPNAGDTAIFDGNGTGNCQMNVALTTSTVIDASAAGYTGTIDAATDNLNHNVGNVTVSGGTLDMGSGTWTCSGSWDFSGGGTCNRNASTLVMTGTSQTLSGETLNVLQIDSGATITASDSAVAVLAGCTVNGSLTMTGVNLNCTGGTVTLGSSSTLTGTGSLFLRNTTNTFNSGATLTIAEIQFRSTHTVPAFDYSGVASVVLRSFSGGTETMTLASGTHTFDGLALNSTNASGTLAFANSTNNPNLVIQGDVVATVGSTSDLTWTAGTGTITANGTNAQSWQWYDANMTAIQTLEDIEIDKASNTLTLASNIKTQSLLITDGDFSSAGFDVDTTANFSNVAGSTIDPSGLNGSAFTIGGNLSLNGSGAGSELDLRAGATWTLTVTGTAAADYVNVANSDASGGTAISATNSFDYGGNTNWSGLATPAKPRYYYQQLMQVCA